MVVQVILSGRNVVREISVRTSGIQINAIPSNEAQGSVILLKQFMCHTYALKTFLIVFFVFICHYLIDLNCLTLTFNEPPTKNKNSNSVSQGNLYSIVTSYNYLCCKRCLFHLDSQDSKIQTSHIGICTMESQSLAVTLDRDCHRTYRDVQR